ncbi:MAG: hypothetical protein EOP11_07930 [Proteobacteria bacterium]|nr:MAG: hypothetical protein EOP11_07930 [Pseudomonadota bacterium]
MQKNLDFNSLGYFRRALGATGLMLALSLSGCGVRNPARTAKGLITNYTNCIQAPDQSNGTYQGRWAGLPIPIVFDRDFYTADNGGAMPGLRAAAETWNNWSRLKGKQAFKINSDGVGQTAGRDIPEIDSCDQGSYSSSVTDMVGIWKIATAGAHANIRPNCGRILAFDPATGAGVQGQTDWTVINGKITGASILLNFEGYNAPGRLRIDAESLLLHEMGHVLGLLHSCNGSGTNSTDGTTAPACDFAPDSYKTAVMFPFLQPQQERRTLGQNDYNRINCLY